MILRRYILEDCGPEPAAMIKIDEELAHADRVVMKFGYPNGKDSDEVLIIYALFPNGKINDD